MNECGVAGSSVPNKFGGSGLTPPVAGDRDRAVKLRGTTVILGDGSPSLAGEGSTRGCFIGPGSGTLLAFPT